MTSHLIAYNRHYEIDLNPYVVSNRKYKGKNLAIISVRNENLGPSGATAEKRSGLTPGTEKLLVDVYNKYPDLRIILINEALKSNMTPENPYIAKSFQAINLGKLNYVKGYVLELSMGATANLVEKDRQASDSGAG